MVSAFATIALVELIFVVHHFVFDGASGERMALLPWWQLLFAPALGGLLVGLLLHRFTVGQRYHGVSDVMEAAAIRGGAMDFRSGVTSSIATVVSLGSGASLGREGPAIHLCATLTAWVSKKFHFDRSESLVLLGCAAAAAVTASFDAPIAGVLFALEVIVGYYSLRALAPTVVSVIGALIVTRQVLGDSPAIHLSDYAIASLWELPAFALLGIVAGCVGLVMIYLVQRFKLAWQKLACPGWLQPAAAGLVVGAIALQFPLVLGVGYEATDLALDELLTVAMLVCLLVAKILATSVCLSAGFAGGIFSPGLFIGAMLGGSFWWVAASIVPEMASSQGAYSIVGMAGVASALLGAPISTILIIFELTNDYHLIAAVMLTSAIASSVMQFSPHKTFFRWQLEQRGINLNIGRNQNLLMANTVKSLVSQSFSRVGPDSSLGESRRQLVRDRVSILLVVDEDDRLVGSATLHDLMSSEIEDDPDAPVTGHLRDNSFSLTTTTSLNGALELFDLHRTDCAPVVGDDNGKLEVIGVVYRGDVIHNYNEALREARDEEYGVN